MKPEFESLRIYLGQNGSDLKRFQLSKRIADTFDQYLLFRPEMILEWETGRENHWQPFSGDTWFKENGNGHRAALGRAFMEAVNRSSAGMENFPRRISVFGISFLPRFHMQIFAGLSGMSG
jgi:exodeoxyribonuclease V gamma subunit